MGIPSAGPTPDVHCQVHCYVKLSTACCDPFNVHDRGMCLRHQYGTQTVDIFIIVTVKRDEVPARSSSLAVYQSCRLRLLSPASEQNA